MFSEAVNRVINLSFFTGTLKIIIKVNLESFGFLDVNYVHFHFMMTASALKNLVLGGGDFVNYFFDFDI